MRKLIALLFLFICLPALATDVVFTLSDFAGISTTTNRWVKIQPMSVPTANSSSIVIGSSLNYTSSVSGTFTITNMAYPILYQCSVMAPPNRTDFKIYVSTNTLGTIQASMILAADSTATFPAGTVAWSAASSDLRYASSANVLTNGALLTGTNTWTGTNDFFGHTILENLDSITGSANPTNNDQIVVAGSNVTVVTNGNLRTISSSGGGGSTPTGTGIPHIVSGTQDAAASLIVNADVSASASIAESKLSLASDAAANVASRRTLGTAALTAAAGDDSRILGAVQTNAMVFSNTVFVTKSGNDGAGVRGRFDKPFLTITAAKNASSSGDTVEVFAGTYVENALLKIGVNYYFHPGAVVRYQQDLATGTAYGIFDDRASGATTNIIAGSGKFIYHAGTNGNTDDFGFLGNPLCRGGIVITNANTTFKIEGDEAQSTSYDNTFASSTGAIYVENCRYVSAKFKRIYDPLGTNTIVMVSDFGGELIPFLIAPNTVGIYWGVGETHIDCEEVNENGHLYSIWCNEGVQNTGTDFYYNGNVVTGKTYISGISPNWRTWLNVKWLNGATAEGYYILGGGKHYLTAQKVSTDITAGGGAVINSAASATGTTNQAWLTIQKISSPRHWVANSSGAITFAKVQHFEDTGSVTNGIQIDGGVLHLEGDFAQVRNGNAILHNGGTTYVKNLTLDTDAANNAGNTPVFVTANGLYLQNCVLVAPALADSIKGSGSFNVGSYGSVANKDKNANIALSPTSGLTVDPNVQ